MGVHLRTAQEYLRTANRDERTQRVERARPLGGRTAYYYPGDDTADQGPSDGRYIGKIRGAEYEAPPIDEASRPADDVPTISGEARMSAENEDATLASGSPEP